VQCIPPVTFLLSQAVHQESNDDDSDTTHDLGRSVSHPIIDRFAPDLEAASTDELSVLLEHVQLIMEQRSRITQSNPPAVSSSTRQPAALQNLGHMIPNAITAKPVNGYSSRQNIQSPFKSLDQQTSAPASDPFVGSAPSHVQSVTSTHSATAQLAQSKIKPYVHNAGGYQLGSMQSAASLLGTPEKNGIPGTFISSEQYVNVSSSGHAISQLALSQAGGVQIVAVATANTDLLSALTDQANNRAQLRRSLSGDATHQRSHKQSMHPLATGYHTMQTGTLSSKESKPLKQAVSCHKDGNTSREANSGTPLEDEEQELGTAFGRRTTPTKLASTERYGLNVCDVTFCKV
jgi:hypothetical protein